MKINTREKPFRYPVPFDVEIEKCPHCLVDLEQEYFIGIQRFIFECLECRCDDQDISMYNVIFDYNEHVEDIACWTQEFSLAGLYVKTDLVNENSKLHRLIGPLLHDPIDIPFTIFGIINRDIIIKKLSIYSKFS